MRSRWVPPFHRLLPTRVLPPPGDSYELFDLACLFWVTVVSTYAIAEPSPSTSVALQWLVGPTPLAVWSVALNVAALAALVCSFAPPAVRIGRGIVFAGASLWSAVLCFGWLVDYQASASVETLTEGVRMGVWWFLATLIATFTVHTVTGNKPWRRALGAGVVAGLVVWAVMILLVWSGDPRPFVSAVFYGFMARTAHHQTHEACRGPYR